MTKKQIIIWSAAVVVVIALAIIFPIRRPSPTVYNTNTPTSTPAAQEPAAATTTPPVAKPAAKAASYGDLVNQYQNRRIQFNSDCQATPNNVTFKNPVTLMLDNRSPKAAKITIGKISYSLSAWGYKIITINERTLPKTDMVSCNATYNVAQILMQK